MRHRVTLRGVERIDRVGDLLRIVLEILRDVEPGLEIGHHGLRAFLDELRRCRHEHRQLVEGVEVHQRIGHAVGFRDGVIGLDIDHSVHGLGGHGGHHVVHVHADFLVVALLQSGAGRDLVDEDVAGGRAGLVGDLLAAQLGDGLDAEILARHHARGLADIFDHGDGDQAAFVVADDQRGAGIGAHVDLARHHLLHGEVARRHREFLELDAVLFEIARAHQVIGRHAPHVGLVALPHRLQRRAGAAHAQSRRQRAGAGGRQRMAARNAFLQKCHVHPPCICLRIILSEKTVAAFRDHALNFPLACFSVSPALASWPRYCSNSFWHSTNSTLSGSRGRGSGILITAFTVPGCGVITTTRSAR